MQPIGDLSHVIFDGGFGQPQSAANLFVMSTLGYLAQNLILPLGQRSGGRIGRLGGFPFAGAAGKLSQNLCCKSRRKR